MKPVTELILSVVFLSKYEPGVREPSHMKFYSGAEFSILNQIEKEKKFHTLMTTRTEKNIFYFISPRGENIFKWVKVWIKQNLWKTAFKTFKVISPLRLSSADFTWSILEYLDPNFLRHCAHNTSLRINCNHNNEIYGISLGVNFHLYL